MKLTPAIEKTKKRKVDGRQETGTERIESCENTPVIICEKRKSGCVIETNTSERIIDTRRFPLIIGRPFINLDHTSTVDHCSP